MKVNSTQPSDRNEEASSTPPDDTTTTSSTCDVVSSPLIPRILSGSVGSIVTALAVTPLEVVKIRQQAAGVVAQSTIAPTSFRGIKVEPCPGCGTLVLNNGLMDCVLPVESTTSLLRSSSSSIPKTGGTISTLLSIFRNEGSAGLYAGLRPTLVMSVPNTVLYFTAYDEISMRLRRNHAANNSIENNNMVEGRQSTMTKLEEDDAKRQAYIPLVAGSTARLLASLVTAPLELIRTRQASIGSNIRIGEHPVAVPGMMEEFRTITRANGISSLYVGLAPTLWRDVPFSALYWLFLERFRNHLSDSNNLGAWGGFYYREHGIQMPASIQAMHAFVSGAAAGSIAAAFTTPFDVVKTRRQMVGVQAETIAMDSCDHFGLKEYSNRQQQTCKCGKPAAVGYRQSINVETFRHMQQIVQKEGIGGLWKGNLTRMVKVAPACAIMISCYEFGKRLFGEVL
ncbi:hypothetical protein ACHAXR_006944 [Thalassiosira sp. AJA248-18]